MSQISQTNKPISLNMDKAFKELSETEAFYLLNHERHLNLKERLGSNVGKKTPIPANYKGCDIEQPQGENYTVGAYRSPITNELYSWHHNSNNVDYILRTTNKGCEIVYAGDLGLSPDPKHSIEQWRAFLKVEKTCKNQGGKQLIWVTGNSDVYQLDVEASINTDFFTTPFFERCSNGEEFLKMYVPQPCDCIDATYLPIQLSEMGLSNKLVHGFKFMYQHEYYDGRKSEWSDRSKLYYQDSKGCFDTTDGLSRCMALKIPIGNPLVEKIHIAFSTDNGVTWFKYDTVEKYKKYNDAQQMWYERGLSEDITDNGYSEEDCNFEYEFCNNKQCTAIDPKEITRVYNPIPREAQGLFPIKDALAFYNYKTGVCPVDKKEVEQITIKEDCVEDKECTPDMVEVTVRAIIHNFTHNLNQFVYRMGNGSKDDVKDTAMFGGLNDKTWLGVGGGLFEDAKLYDQYFTGEVRNFIVYIEGTSYWAEMKQKRSSAYFNSHQDWQLAYDLGDRATQNNQRRVIKSGNFYYQEATIKVPKGTRGFLRLASHKAEGNEQNTSTFVVGVLDNLKQYRGNNISSYKPDEEIYFDTCNATDNKVDIMRAFVIQDNAVDSGAAKAATAFYGYLKDATGRPIEGAIVAPMEGTRASNYFTSRTDHNGFWHITIDPKPNFFVVSSPLLALLQKDVAQVSFSVRMESGTTGEFAGVKTFEIEGEPKTGTGSDQSLDVPEYDTDYYTNLKMKVEDCDGNPVGGLRVAISGGKYDTTNAMGFAEFRVRNYQGGGRQVRMIVLDHKGCFNIDCADNCNPCSPTEVITLGKSFKGNPTVPHVVAMPQVINTRSAVLNQKGLKRGGRYGWGIVFQGMGRVSAPYHLSYMDIPKLQTVGKLGFCNFKWSVNPNAKFDEWIECAKLVRTKNMNGFELQWVVDEIEHMANQRVRLTIQSLNDYNSDHLFKTNTVYQFLEGDRIEFIRNGDGKVFDDRDGILNYLTLSPYKDKETDEDVSDDADYFNQIIIEDDGRLANLKEGAVIEFQRDKECGTDPIYYEICENIPFERVVVSGGENYSRPVINGGSFETFDTFLVNRQIGNLAPLVFEHHSPSDFAIHKFDDTGKGHVQNIYENERRMGRSITVNAPRQFNYFGDMVKHFGAPEQGDIVAIGIKDARVLLAICENDSFVAQVADDLVRVGANGVIQAANGDAIITDPSPSISGEYGCQYPHIGSILFGSGWITWCDVNKHNYIRHDYSKAEAVSLGRVEAHFRRRCQEIETVNRNTTDHFNHYRFVTGQNQATGAVYITIKTLRQSGINNGYKPYEVQNDTIIYHPIENDWLGFASFTPEMYGNLDIFDGDGCAFVTFLQGEPYFHPVVPTKFNEFFGVACDMVTGITINAHKEKKKRAAALEIQDNTMWFVEEVTSDIEGFTSFIPPVRMKQNPKELKWNGAFLGNTNGRGGLWDGDRPSGYYINVTLVRDNTDALKYNTFDDTKRTKYSELDLILFKFTASEQSGYTENL